MSEVEDSELVSKKPADDLKRASCRSLEVNLGVL